jgi:hypothetical protein
MARPAGILPNNEVVGVNPTITLLLLLPLYFQSEGYCIFIPYVEFVYVKKAFFGCWGADIVELFVADDDEDNDNETFYAIACY